VDTIPLELAFSRFGAAITGGQRPKWATAQDGSLVLVCQSSGFSRPGAGVLRYSASLSRTATRTSRVEALRLSLDAARSAGTPVRLIIHTLAAGGGSGRIHVRPDLVGSIAAFDGDAYSVDFVRLAVDEPETAPRARRKR
jgi:hypothetical protein